MSQSIFVIKADTPEQMRDEVVTFLRRESARYAAQSGRSTGADRRASETSERLLNRLVTFFEDVGIQPIDPAEAHHARTDDLVEMLSDDIEAVLAAEKLR